MIRKIRPITRQITSLSTYNRPQSQSLILFSQTKLASQTPNHHNHLHKSNNHNNQERKANMGKMLDYLTTILPNALHTVPESQYLAENIILRVAPTVSSNLPLLKGRVSYITTLKATQFILVNFLLNPQVKLHITDIRTQFGGDGFVRNEDLDGYGLFKGSDKIVVKWRTCMEDCEHLLKVDKDKDGRGSGSGFALKGGHILERFDIKKLWSHYGVHPHSDEDLNIDGVSKIDDESQSLERIIYGIFVFELDSKCEKIIVHNVENIEMYDKKDFVDDGLGKLARV